MYYNNKNLYHITKWCVCAIVVCNKVACDRVMCDKVVCDRVVEDMLCATELCWASNNTEKIRFFAYMKKKQNLRKQIKRRKLKYKTTNPIMQKQREAQWLLFSFFC